MTQGREWRKPSIRSGESPRGAESGDEATVRIVDLRRALGRALWRVAESVIALVIAVVTLPLLVLTASASAFTYRASPFFVHERIGQHGRPFRFVKIRTLPLATPHYADKFEIRKAAAPRLMQLVRRTHLDELPQLWFVISGHMSLVGPRPEMAVLHARIHPDVAAERARVRPGITGLWQISVHCDGLIVDRTEYDRLYIRHRSALLDLWILVETVRKMVFGTRIHLFQVPHWAIRTERRGRVLPPVQPPSAPAGLTTVTIDLIGGAPLVDLTEAPGAVRVPAASAAVRR